MKNYVAHTCQNDNYSGKLSKKATLQVCSEDQPVSDPVQKANIFNSYFAYQYKLPNAHFYSL